MRIYDVTIGIPIYNSVGCIQMSLMSALSQSYPSIEYLLIDDGCTDGTFDLISSLVKVNHRFNDVRILTHTENLGVTASRNQIIDEALGEYLYFMDSDDTIVENTIELLTKNARQYNAEVVFGSYEKIETTGKKILYQYPSIQFFKEDEFASYAYRKYAGIQASACNYLVKTSILRENNHRFINSNYWEDFVFTFDLVTLISRAVLLPDITYSYICRECSLSNYQRRDIVSKEEVMQNVNTVNHLKNTSLCLHDKSYFPNRCYNIVMTDFYIACNVIKRRQDISPGISNHEIKLMMSHPAKWAEIRSFKQSRLKNIFLLFLGNLPSSLCVSIIWVVGKLKKLI